MPDGPDWWISGKQGSLAPWAQAQVWGLHVMAKKLDVKVSNGDIAAMVTKVGGGHPCQQAIAQWRSIFDEDPDWYPGQQNEEAQKRGPKRKFTVQKQMAIAKSAMALKAAGEEPTVDAVRARCPTASINPDTGNVFDDKLILEVFRTRCYDNDPEHPWKHQNALQKTSLPANQIKARFDWSKEMERLGHTEGWFHRHCIWFDPCYTIIPGTARTEHNHEQARYGKGKRWISDDARRYSRNLMPSEFAKKQKSNGDTKVWWMIVVSRDKVKLHFLGEAWEQTGHCFALFLKDLPGILDKMFGKSAVKPRVLFTDRGPGMYQGAPGTIIQAYKDAVHKNGFRTFVGDDASWQPGDLSDLFMHETVAAWAAHYFKNHPLKAKSLETVKKRLSECEAYCNTCEVSDLTHSLPRRIAELRKNKGDRLKY